MVVHSYGKASLWLLSMFCLFTNQTFSYVPDNVEIQVLGSALVAVTAPGLLQEPMAYLAADQLPEKKHY